MIRVRRHLRRRFVPAKAPELFKYHPESQKLVWMNPDKYLRLVGVVEGDEEHWVGEDLVQIGHLMKRMRKGLEIDPLFLEIDVEDGRIMSQEGRHRASAAKRLGIAEVPVILYARKKAANLPTRWVYADASELPEDLQAIRP